MRVCDKELECYNHACVRVCVCVRVCDHACTLLAADAITHENPCQLDYSVHI